MSKSAAYTSLAILFGILFICLPGLPSLICLSIVMYFVARAALIKHGDTRR